MNVSQRIGSAHLSFARKKCKILRVVSTLDAEFHSPTGRFARILTDVGQRHIRRELIMAGRRHAIAPQVIFWKVKIEDIADIEIGAVAPQTGIGLGCRGRSECGTGFSGIGRGDRCPEGATHQTRSNRLDGTLFTAMRFRGPKAWRLHLMVTFQQDATSHCSSSTPLSVKSVNTTHVGVTDR